MKSKFTSAILMMFAICYSASAQIETARVTECWPGQSGADGTADWFEVTNTGDVPFDTGQIFYDDSDPMFGTGGFLESLNLMPGESAIFLTSVEADSPDFDNAFFEYLAIWGDGIIGIPGGGGNLGGSGDQVNLFSVENGSTLVPIDTLEYSGDIVGGPTTIERTGMGPTDVRMSVLSENGAVESNTFPSDDMPPVNLTIVGSPGVFMGFAKVIIGDVNGDGVVDLLDVGPFVDLLSSGDFNASADINGDGIVDLLDVGPFVELLAG